MHLPRSHYENPACPHWLRCLDVSQKAMPVIQLCAMAPDITGLNSLTCFPLYLIGMVWLQEWRLRGDRMGLLRNSIEYCSLVLQKLSERWASAGNLLNPCLLMSVVYGFLCTICCVLMCRSIFNEITERCGEYENGSRSHNTKSL